MAARWEGSWGPGERGEGIKEYKSSVTKQPQGCRVQHSTMYAATMYGVLDLWGALCKLYKYLSTMLYT